MPAGLQHASLAPQLSLLSGSSSLDVWPDLLRLVLVLACTAVAPFALTSQVICAGTFSVLCVSRLAVLLIMRICIRRSSCVKDEAVSFLSYPSYG